MACKFGFSFFSISWFTSRVNWFVVKNIDVFYFSKSSSGLQIFKNFSTTSLFGHTWNINVGPGHSTKQLLNANSKGFKANSPVISTSKSSGYIKTVISGPLGCIWLVLKIGRNSNIAGNPVSCHFIKWK